MDIIQCINFLKIHTAENYYQWKILDVLDKEQESVGLMRAIYNDKISTL